MFRTIIFILQITISVSAFCQTQKDIIVRICHGDFPGQKGITGDRYPTVICAYSYYKTKPIFYEVVSFDLVYKNPDGTTEVARGKGNQLTPVMQTWLIKADSSTFHNFFIDNAVLFDKNKKRIKIRGLMPAIRRN